MRLLLDTNVLYRWAEGRPISANAAATVTDPRNDVFISVVSLCEMGVKSSAGKSRVPPLSDEELALLQIEVLTVTASVARRLAVLPLLHKDPFDRMLVAQALEESLTLVTTDRHLAGYGIATIAA